MPQHFYGRHTDDAAAEKLNYKINTAPSVNNITRRNVMLTETMPNRRPSSSLLSANIKSLRLFRHICRMLPFILKINEINHRVTPVQSKRYVANWFRENAKETDLVRIDYLIQYGYETVYEAEMDYCNTGYLYRFIAPSTHRYRDFGIDRFYEKKADRINQQPSSKFLESFYRGKKSHVQ